MSSRRRCSSRSRSCVARTDRGQQAGNSRPRSAAPHPFPGTRAHARECLLGERARKAPHAWLRVAQVGHRVRTALRASVVARLSERRFVPAAGSAAVLAACSLVLLQRSAHAGCAGRTAGSRARSGGAFGRASARGCMRGAPWQDRRQGRSDSRHPGSTFRISSDVARCPRRSPPIRRARMGTAAHTA